MANAEQLRLTAFCIVKWWVNPFIFCCVVLKWLGFPIDPDGRMLRIMMRGIIPVVK